MSLILDALNRAEHDRKNKNAVPDINTVHVLASPVTAPPSANPMLVLIAISLMIIAIILSVWFFRASSTALPTAVPSVVAPQQPVVQITAPSIPEPLTSTIEAQTIVTPVAATETSVAPAVENLYAETSADENIPDASVEKLYEPEVVEPLSEAVVTPFEPAQQTPVENGAVVNETTQLSADQQVQEQLVTGMTTKPQRHYDEIDVQDFASLGWNQKQQIPTLSYSRHNYLPQNVSTVVINGETLGEGNAFGGGSFVVDEIFVDGVVLSFRGNKFKLRALNGWVNM